MTETAINRFWELRSGAIALNPEAFKLIETPVLGDRAVLYVAQLLAFSGSWSGYYPVP